MLWIGGTNQTTDFFFLLIHQTHGKGWKKQSEKLSYTLIRPVMAVEYMSVYHFFPDLTFQVPCIYSNKRNRVLKTPQATHSCFFQAFEEDEAKLLPFFSFKTKPRATFVTALT